MFGLADPLGLDPRARTAYLYAAEVLVALIGIHLRLVWPEPFRLGIIDRYGMFIAMAVIFGTLKWMGHRRLALGRLDSAPSHLPMLAAFST